MNSQQLYARFYAIQQICAQDIKGANKMDVVKQFAERIRVLREKMGLSQSEFASKLDVSRGSISFYENASRTPDIYFLGKVYDYFDEEIPMEYLLGYTDNIKRENELLGLYTGLNDEAIEGLSYLDSEVINEILTNEKFFKFAYTLNRYIDAHTEQQCILGNCILDNDYRNDTMAYLFGEYFKEIMYDVCQRIRIRRDLKEHGIDIHNETDLRRYADKVFSKLDKEIKQYEKEQEAYDAQRAEEHEKYIQTDEYKERKQKHEKLKALVAELDKKQGDSECPQ